MSGSFSANGLTSGAVLFFIFYGKEGTITYNGMIRVNTGYLSSGSIKISKGVNLLFVTGGALTVVSF